MWSPQIITILTLAVVLMASVIYVIVRRPELLYNNMPLIILIAIALALAVAYLWKRWFIEGLKEPNEPVDKCYPGAPLEAPIMSYSSQPPELKPQSTFGSFDKTCYENPIPEEPSSAEIPYEFRPEDQVDTSERGTFTQKPDFRVKNPVCKVNGVELHKGTYSKLAVHPGDLPDHLDRPHDTTLSFQKIEST